MPAETAEILPRLPTCDQIVARATMIARDPTDVETWLLSLPPTRRQTRWAVVVAVCQITALALLAPFAKTRLAQIDAFIPAFEGVIFVTDLVTSALLFSQFAIYRLRALLVLACGYLFTALMIIPHALTFPGAFSPTGLLGAGLQTTAWIYWFWHLLFPVALLVYGLMKDEKPVPGPAQASSLAVIGRCVALVVALVCGLTLLATAGNDYMPQLSAERVSFTPANDVLGAVTTLVCVSALAVLGLRRRSLLDQWLMIVALAAILEMGLAVIFISGRFSLGFYAGRVFSLLTSTVVLVVLLAETTRLYANVARSNMRLQREQSSRLMNLEAMTASIAHEVKQPLTALVANAGAARQWIARTPPDLDEARAALDDVIEAGHCVSGVFDNIRALFRRGNLKEESINLNKLAQRVLDAFADEFKRHHVAARIELSSALPPVVGHAGQLQEVLFNLVQNAVEAMDAVAEDRRLLHVRTKHRGDRISLTVQDSGPGFDEKILSSLFNTFISTKSAGMGLGLAICRMIIERHGGEISAAKADPHGAVFRVELPAGRWPPHAKEPHPATEDMRAKA
jgi:signal transduction histidine kinase